VLNVSPRTIKVLIAAGCLPSVKIGSRRRIRRTDVLRAVANGVPQPDAPAADQVVRA
jgi:excisionase family DNA binding protein